MTYIVLVMYYVEQLLTASVHGVNPEPCQIEQVLLDLGSMFLDGLNDNWYRGTVQ